MSKTSSAMYSISTTFTSSSSKSLQTDETSMSPVGAMQDDGAVIEKSPEPATVDYLYGDSYNDSF